MSHELTAATPLLQVPRKTLLTVLLSIGYAAFVVFFPWDEISRGGFPDFEQYVNYFNYFATHDVSKFGEYQLDSILEYFIREALWYECVYWLTSMTGEAATSLRVISFFILFVWGLFLFKRVSYGVALLFLLNPFAIDVAMSGIRNGLAWSLVIVGIMTQSRILRATLFLAGMWIHTAALPLVVLYYLSRLASRFMKGGALLLAGLGIGIFLGLLLTVGSEFVLGAIGDRRQGANYIVGGGSLMQALLWAALLCFMCLSGRAYIRQNIFVIAVLAWYLTMNPFIPWSYRIWGAFLPVIALSAMNLPTRKRQMFTYLYSGYLALQYLYWTKLFDYWYPA